MNEMILSLEGAAFVRGHEGFVDHWYADPVGIGTIGIGFTWASAGFRLWWERNRNQSFGPGAKMTREEADKVLIFVSQVEYGKAVNTFLARAVKQHVFDGMVSPVFNLGPGSLKWKWAAAVKDGDLADAAARLRSTGTTAKGRPLKGLQSRRKEEAELLQFGDYTIGDHRKDAMSDGVLVRGERGQAVTDLQTKLKAAGLYAGTVDGIFGYGTQAAVLEFQRSHGLAADGDAGPVTLAALEASTGTEPAPKPVPAPTPIPAKPVDRGPFVVIALFIGAIVAGFGMFVTAAWDFIVNLWNWIF